MGITDLRLKTHAVFKCFIGHVRQIARIQLRLEQVLVVTQTYLILFYIHNRYVCQQQTIEIDKLKKELTDIKYDALTRSSELMELSRQSRIEEYIKTRDSQLQIATNPPYLIKD